jgi:hypothetical protein
LKLPSFLSVWLTWLGNKFTIQHFLTYESDRPDLAAPYAVHQWPITGVTPVPAAAIKPKKY